MIFDLHNDFATSDEFGKSDFIPFCDEVIYAFWTTELADPLNYIFGSLPKLGGAPFAVEDLWFINCDRLQELCLRRPYYCSLTHNAQNELAGGALSQGSLTAKGKQAIKVLNRNGVALDAAHLNRKSFYQAAEVAERFFVSHAGLDFVCRHKRNLTDNQVKTVLERGGIIGLTAVEDFIGGSDVNSYIRTIDSFVQRFGTDGASVGSDFYGTKPITGLSRYEDFGSAAEKLINMGYSYADVNKIFYDNAKNYFLQEISK